VFPPRHLLLQNRRSRLRSAKPAAQPPQVRKQGAAKKKGGDPRGVWVGQRPKKDQGQIFFDIFIVFLNSPHRETPKNVIKKNREKIGFGFLVEFFVKVFDTICFTKRFL
jgi:hypothetical protein